MDGIQLIEYEPGCIGGHGNGFFDMLDGLGQNTTSSWDGPTLLSILEGRLSGYINELKCGWMHSTAFKSIERPRG